MPGSLTGRNRASILKATARRAFLQAAGPPPRPPTTATASSRPSAPASSGPSPAAPTPTGPTHASRHPLQPRVEHKAEIPHRNHGRNTGHHRHQQVSRLFPQPTPSFPNPQPQRAASSFLAVRWPRFPADAPLPADRFGPLPVQSHNAARKGRAPTAFAADRARASGAEGPGGPYRAAVFGYRAALPGGLAALPEGSAEFGSALPALRHRLSRRAPFGCAALSIPLLQIRHQPRSLRSRPPRRGRLTRIVTGPAAPRWSSGPTRTLTKPPNPPAALRNSCYPSAQPFQRVGTRLQRHRQRAAPPLPHHPLVAPVRRRLVEGVEQVHAGVAATRAVPAPPGSCTAGTPPPAGSPAARSGRTAATRQPSSRYFPATGHRSTGCRARLKARVAARPDADSGDGCVTYPTRGYRRPHQPMR